MDAWKAVGMITPCSHALSDSRESLIGKIISVVLLIVLRVNMFQFEAVSLIVILMSNEYRYFYRAPAVT